MGRQGVQIDFGVPGAYWKAGTRTNATRVNGTAFATKDELEQHLKMLEEADI